MDEDVAVSVEIPKTSVSLIFLEDEGEGEVPIAAVFDEKIADEMAEFITGRWPLPEGTAVGVRLVAVHPEMIEKWARGEV
jgi:hypothetical protein